MEYQGLIVNTIGSHYDEYADQRDAYLQKNRYYYDLVFHHYRTMIPPGKNVLEIGCGTGTLLAMLRPRHGVGIDCSQRMIEKARTNYPELEFVYTDISTFSTTVEFDYIVLAGTIGESEDIQTLLNNLHPFCSNHTRIVIEYFNPIWRYGLKLAELIRRKLPQPRQNWVSRLDIVNFCSLADIEPITQSSSVLIPFKIPMVSTLLNKYLAKLPLIGAFALSHLIVTRVKKPLNQHSSVSIVIPCRNEKGNIANALDQIPIFGSHQEIIFVEGGSTDGTYDEIQRLIAEQPARNLSLYRQTGTGKGDAVRTGFEHSKNHILMILDADLTVAPEELPRFYDAIRAQKGELINGTRLIYPMQDNAMQFFNMLANKLFGSVFSWLLGQTVTDTLCGTKVLMRRDYLRIADDRSYFGELDPFGDFDLLFGAARLNLKIVDLPIRYRQRLYGSTNIRRWHHGWILVRMVRIAANKLKFT